jgi:hypothetical protein
MKKINNTVTVRTNGINYTFVTRTISRQEYDDLGKNIEPEPLAERFRKALGLDNEHQEEA